MANQPHDGTWYVVVTCDRCERDIFLFRDLTKGKGNLQASYIVKCPFCLKDGSYNGRHYLDTGEEDEAFRRFRAAS